MANQRNTRNRSGSYTREENTAERSRTRRNESQRTSRDSYGSSRHRSQDRDGSYADAYSRRSSREAYANEAKKQKRRRIIRRVLLSVLALVVVGAGVAFALYSNVAANLREGLDPNLNRVLVKTNLTKEPFYILLMGTDESSDRAASEEFAGDQFRSDSIMLTRIDPVNKKVTMVSIHRDTLVDMGEYGENKLNAAHALGGAALSVEVVSELAGVPISHYAEVNFDGFKEIVDALGGIEVEVPMEIDDPDAGGYLAPGLQTLNGDQALILARARHAYDDFGDGDSYRAANQRLVLSAIAKKILASDVATIASTVTALSEHVTTDLAVTDIIGLAQAMRGLDPETDIYSAMEPTTSAYVDGVWYEYNNTTAWRAMMARVDQGLPPTEEDIIDDVSGTVLATTGGGSSSVQNDSSGSSASKTGYVDVKNGSGIDGVASVAGDKLREVGYTVDVGNAEAYDYPETIVIYNYASQANEAKEIATTIGVGKAQLNDGSYVYTGDFLVVIGADWA